MRFAKLNAELKFLFVNANLMAFCSVNCLCGTSNLGIVKYAESSRARFNDAGFWEISSVVPSFRRASSMDMAMLYSEAEVMSLLASSTSDAVETTLTNRE